MSEQTRKGLVLGVYEGDSDKDVSLTKAAEDFNNSKSNQLLKLIEVSGLAEKKGKSRVFYGLDEEYSSVAVVSLGKRGAGFCEQEQLDLGRDNVRTAVATGVKELYDAGASVVHVDPCGDAEAAAEGAYLNLFVYDDLKAEDKKKPMPDLGCYVSYTDSPESIQEAWKRGTVLGEGQNFARSLMEAPANKMTPTIFGKIAKEKLGKLDKVQVTVRDQSWAESMKMGSFLSVSRGSSEPLRFVEVKYSGSKEGDAPLAIVGKGVTFDSGGISLKPPANMDALRGDMGGAACTLASIYTAARLGLAINVMGFMPLCENMPGQSATKPGDVVTAMNGKTIQVDNTDAEGRLILCDTLLYAQTFKPRAIVDMATLTGAIKVALGAATSACFTNSKVLWDTILKASQQTGDRVWRMPLFKLYSKQITESQLADINNFTGSQEAGACTAACFLKEFVSTDEWMHIDIAGVMSNKSEVPYLGKGMTGRPTRTIVQFLNNMSK